MKLVNLEIDEQCQSVFPKVRSANVELETIDGRVFNHFSPTRKGDPDNPLLDSELSDKYADLVEPVVGKLAAGALLSTLWSVKELISIKDLKLDNISR
jgi:2-methylcitrate dehydratase PrpD